MNKHLELLEYIESQIGIPFEYGKHDCPLFIAGAIDVMHRALEKTGCIEFTDKVSDVFSSIWCDDSNN